MSNASGERLILTVHVNRVPVAVELADEALEALRRALAPAPSVPAASLYLSTAEAAAVLRCRRRRVYELVADGRLTRHGDGRRLLLCRDEVERLAAGALTAR